MNLSKRNVFIIGAIIALPIIYFLLWTLPTWQGAAYRAKFNDEEVKNFPAEQKIQYERNVADIEDKTRLTLAQIIGGLALLSGLWFTYQNVKTAQENLRVTEEGKLTERFSNAVELLGSDKLDIRLGGIYALERIARDSQKDYWTVMEVLTAFVRENSHRLLPGQKVDTPREDIQAIMTVIGRRKRSSTETQRLNLRRANLAGYSFLHADLSNANLDGANLSVTNFYLANLGGALLNNTDLRGANFAFTNLKETDLINANMSETVLKYAKGLTLSGILRGKNLHAASFDPKLEKELKEWQAKQAKEKAGAEPSEGGTEESNGASGIES